MPAYQSIPEFDLSEKYHLKAVGVRDAPKTHPIKPPSRNGNNWQRSGIRWRIKPLNSRTTTTLNLSDQILFILDSCLSKTHDSDDLSS
jgi:hypothetical protein